MFEYFKKPSGEVIRYEPGRMKRKSCEAKYVLCDITGKEIKKAEPKGKTKKAGK